MPDQHKLTREEHKVAVVKFTQELTDHPAGQCWQRLRVSSSSSAASSVKAVSGGDVMSDDESAGLDGKLTPSPSMASAWGCAPTHGGIDWRC